DGVAARLRSFFGWHRLLTQHDLHPIQSRRCLDETLFVRELIQAHVAALLVGVALKTVLRQEGQHRLLKRSPIPFGLRPTCWPGTGGGKGDEHETTQQKADLPRHDSSPQRLRDCSITLPSPRWGEGSRVRGIPRPGSCF